MFQYQTGNPLAVVIIHDRKGHLSRDQRLSPENVVTSTANQVLLAILFCPDNKPDIILEIYMG